MTTSSDVFMPPADRQAERISDMLCARIAGDPKDVIAVDLHGGRLIAAEVDVASTELAAELNALPGPGLVLVQTQNCLAAMPALLGVLRSRHALVTLHPEVPRPTVAEAFSRLGPVAAVTVKGRCLAVQAEPYGRSRPIWSPPAARPEFAIALCVLTSGTTGRPRLIVAPHRQVIASVARIQIRLGYCPSDIVPIISPLSFDYGLYQVFLTWLAGGTSILDPALNTVANVLVTVARSQATVLPLVPTMLRAMVESPLASRVDTSRIRLITTTGDLLTESDAQAAAAAFPNATVLPMYGLSECKRVAITPSGENRPPGAVGRSLDGTDAAVVDTYGRRITLGAVGELVVTGPHLTLGYLADVGTTARRFAVDTRNGNRLLRTGDRLRMDHEGWMYWVGRSHDVIKTSGYRIDPAEIETAAVATGLVAESGAYGRPDPGRGQVPVLRVRLRDGVSTNAANDSLAAALRAALPPWAVPKIEVSVTELPRTRNGKIDREALQAAADGPTNAMREPIGPGDDEPTTPLIAAAAFPCSTNFINCHTQAVQSAYALPGPAGQPALFELATTVPFGVKAQLADPNRILVPWLDPDLGLDRATTMLGLHAEVGWHDDAGSAFARLARWLRTGPVVLGPLDLGGLAYHGLADTLRGCDHYVVALGHTARGAVVLTDPEGYAQVEIQSATLERAWAATAVPEGRGRYMMRRISPPSELVEPTIVLARIAEAAIANLEMASRTVDAGPSAYRALADTHLDPSRRRGLCLLLPAAAARARLAARFAGLVATVLPDTHRWRRLLALWERQVATLARTHYALVSGDEVADGLHAAAETEHQLTAAAIDDWKRF